MEMEIRKRSRTFSVLRGVCACVNKCVRGVSMLLLEECWRDSRCGETSEISEESGAAGARLVQNQNTASCVAVNSGKSAE